MDGAAAEYVIAISAPSLFILLRLLVNSLKCAVATTKDTTYFSTLSARDLEEIISAQ